MSGLWVTFPEIFLMFPHGHKTATAGPNIKPWTEHLSSAEHWAKQMGSLTSHDPYSLLSTDMDRLQVQWFQLLSILMA